MATKTVTLHNPYKGPMTTKKRKAPKKKPAAAKKAAAPKRRKRRNPAAALANPAPAPKRRRRAHAGPKATHRRRRVRRNPDLPLSEILTAAAIGLLVPSIITTGALQYAKLDPVGTRKYQRLGGAAVAALGAYLATGRHKAIGLALVGGGTAAALSTDLIERALSMLNSGGAPGITATGPGQMKGLVGESMGALTMGALTDAQIAGILDSPEVAAMSPEERFAAAQQLYFIGQQQAA